jgi:putative oxidoreductase
VLVQRLFSAFPNGWPGRGLLLQRVVLATFLFYFGLAYLRESAQSSLVFLHVVGAGAGIFLLLGLCTPICGALITIVEIWIALSWADGAGIAILLATLGATLAMIGPGAWSFDARLFGRKHFEMQQQ